MGKARAVPRAARIAKAAVMVLGRKGAEGLTHRAVDHQARLPEGSTSNHFRTRAALIGAVCDYLTERDLDQLHRAAQRAARPEASTPGVASALADVVERWADDDALYTCARFELFLAARRDPAIAGSLARARAALRDLAAGWLASVARGRTDHLAALMALIEGLTMAQLLHPATKLSRAELEAEILVLLRAIVS